MPNQNKTSFEDSKDTPSRRFRRTVHLQLIHCCEIHICVLMCHIFSAGQNGESNIQVALEIFSERENVDQLEWAMESLKVREEEKEEPGQDSTRGAKLHVEVLQS